MAHKPRKRFGQNFLVDHQVINQIISTIAPQKDDNIIEIGPGKVLSNLIKRIDTNFETLNINSIDHLEEFKL